MLRSHPFRFWAMMFFLATASTLSAADPFVGTWKLNVAKSKGLTESSQINQTITIEQAGPNTFRETITPGTRDGKLGTPFVRTAVWDGSEQPNNNRKDNPPGNYTILIAHPDPTHRSEVFKKDGKETQKAESTVSTDGKVQQVHQWGTGRTSNKPFDFVLVYEKQ